ncbi:unnamed protein product [Rhizophagus irregularis]|nr:unnamed protein product [Rhizophagus irregularis]
MVLRHASLEFEMVFQYSTSGSKKPKGDFSIFDFRRQIVLRHASLGFEMVLRHASLEFEMVFQYSTSGSKKPKGNAEHLEDKFKMNWFWTLE